MKKSIILSLSIFFGISVFTACNKSDDTQPASTLQLPISLDSTIVPNSTDANINIYN